MRTLAPRQAPLAEAPFAAMVHEIDQARIEVANARIGAPCDLKRASLILESLRVQLLLLDRAAS